MERLHFFETVQVFSNLTLAVLQLLRPLPESPSKISNFILPLILNPNFIKLESKNWLPIFLLFIFTF